MFINLKLLCLRFVQCLVVVVTAINAFVMVVLQKKLNLGKYDWRLLVGAFIVPQSLIAVAAALEWLGSNGVWSVTHFFHLYVLTNRKTFLVMRSVYSTPKLHRPVQMFILIHYLPTLKIEWDRRPTFLKTLHLLCV